MAATTLTINSSTLQHFELFIPSLSLSLSLSISLSCSCYSCSFCLCSHCQFAFCSIYSDALTLHFGPTFRFQLASSRTHTHTHTHSYTYIYIYRLCWLLWSPPTAPPFFVWLLPMCCTVHFGHKPKENFIFGHLAKLAAAYGTAAVSVRYKIH